MDVEAHDEKYYVTVIDLSWKDDKTEKKAWLVCKMDIETKALTW